MTSLDRRAFLGGLGGLALAGVVGAPFAPARALSAVPAARIRELRNATKGAVLVPGQAGYGPARLIYNERYDAVKPAAVLQAANVADVRAAVRWAAKYGIRIVARSGGHSYAGYSTTPGLQVDLRKLRGITVRPNGMAIIGSGAALIDIYSTLAAKGRTIPAGSCPSVGIAGHFQGGGMGLAGRRLGLAMDTVQALTIVTANGRLLTCTATQNEDLFWAVRGGGGGNFGIVTSIQVRTTPVTSASYFFANWSWSEATGAVNAWQQFAPDAPPELTSICSLSTGGSQPVVRAFGQFFGGEPALKRLVKPLSDAGATITTGTDGYLDMMLRWAGCVTTPLGECRTEPAGIQPRAAFVAGSDYIAKNLSTAGIRVLLTQIQRRQAQGGSGALLMDAYGGAINEVEPDATAFVHRDQRFCIQELSYFSGSAASSQAWITQTHKALKPHASGQAYQNYIDPNLQNWKQAWYGANLARLQSIKKAVDPDRVFRFKQGF